MYEALGLLFTLGIIGGIVYLIVRANKNGNANPTLNSAPLMYQYADLDPQQIMLVQSLTQNQFKDKTTIFLLTFFLGGLGAHKFYMGNIGLGILYLVFCWTFVPAFIALIECFLVFGYVNRWNAAVTEKAILQVRMMQPRVPVPVR